MSWQVSVFVFPILFATGLALVFTSYAVAAFWKGRRDPLSVVFLCLAVATVVWTGFSALKLSHTDPALKLLFYRLLHVGVAFLPPLVLLFVAAFTDRTRWFRLEALCGLFVVPVVFAVLVVVDPGEVIVAGTEFIETDLAILRVVDGPGFLLFGLFSTVFTLTALGLIIDETRRVGPSYYRQSALLVIAIVAPLVVAAGTTIAIPPFTDDRINFVPVAGSLSIVIFGILVFRDRLFDIPPLAYKTAMKHTPDGLFVLDRHQRIVHANPRGTTLLEAQGGQLGVDINDVCPGFDPTAASEELLEFEDDSEPERSAYYRPFVEPLSRGYDRIGWVLILRDETTQQRQQQRLRQHNQRMEAFSSTVSHDLRNPLNVASGYLELARAESDDASLDHVSTAHDRMETIIEHLFALAKEDRAIAELEPIALKTAAESAWTNVATATTTLSVETDATVVADPAMLQHVLENIFRNASEHGGDDVCVTVGDLEDGFFVEDDGVGIPGTDRDAVFESGYSTTPEGTGFGLRIVQTIADAHGWTLHLTTSRQGGARFEFTDIGVDGPLDSTRG